jgi:hypothetical protein
MLVLVLVLVLVVVVVVVGMMAGTVGGDGVHGGRRRVV